MGRRYSAALVNNEGHAKYFDYAGISTREAMPQTQGPVNFAQLTIIFDPLGGWQS